MIHFTAEEIQDINGYDQYGNVLVELAIYTRPLNDNTSMDSNVCPLPPEVLRYIGKENYRSFFASKRFLQDTMSRRKKLSEKIQECESLIKFHRERLRSRFDATPEKIRSAIQESFPLCSDRVQLRSAMKEHMRTQNDKFKYVFQNSSTRENIAETLEFKITKSVEDKKIYEYLKSFCKEADEFIDNVKITGVLLEEQLLYYMIVIDDIGTIAIHDRAMHHLKNDVGYTDSVLSGIDSLDDIDKYWDRLCKERKHLRTDNKLIALLKDISNMRLELDQSYKTEFLQPVDRKYNTHQEFIDGLNSDKMVTTSNELLSKFLDRLLEEHLKINYGIYLDKSQIFEIQEVLSEENISMSEQDIYDLKTLLIKIKHQNTKNNTASDTTVRQFFEDRKILLSFDDMVILGGIFNRMLSDSKYTQHSYAATLKHFQIAKIPKVLFDNNLFVNRIGTTTDHIMFCSGETISIDPAVYRLFRIATSLSYLTAEQNKEVTKQIMENIKSDEILLVW
jgi:hypothetical protein